MCRHRYSLVTYTVYVHMRIKKSCKLSSPFRSVNPCLSGSLQDGKRHGQGSLYYHGRVFVGGWSASKMALSEVGNVLHQKKPAPMTW